MSRILDNINSPIDLKALKEKELPELAEEIREEVISTVSKTGGHLSSNLGSVELTIALHYVFDTPDDKIVWDVGHQAYAHKLLTGRRESFHTLRQYGGISGFPRREESPYDTFNVGHSSTSISAALGMAEALAQSGQSRRVVAVIGDGSMTAGQAFEGLNQAGYLEKNLIVILNDNEISISPNVGAFASFISRKLTGRMFRIIRREIKDILGYIPRLGPILIQLIRRSVMAFQSIISPGMVFEGFNFRYVGPIKGHRIDRLLEVFQNAKESEGPLLIHVITQKGKGYRPAERDPSKFHGVGPFDVITGKTIENTDQPPSYTSIFGRTMVQLARENPKLIAITAAMPGGTGLDEFARIFPDRFYDVGIAEQHGITFAAGMAVEGFIPVAAIYSTFLQRAYDQVLHDVCLQNLPIVFAVDRGGIVGDDGPTHQGIFDLSYLRHMPNIKVMAPKDENELQHMLFTALSCQCPVAIRYPRGAGVGVPLDSDLEKLEIGKAEVLQAGKDVVILAIGSTVMPALEAAGKLKKANISASVINCRFVKPLDADLIAKVAQKVGVLVTVEENVLEGGFGSAVLELLEKRGITGVKVKRLGIPDEKVEHGTQELLRKKYQLDADGIVAFVTGMLKLTVLPQSTSSSA